MGNRLGRIFGETKWPLDENANDSREVVFNRPVLGYERSAYSGRTSFTTTRAGSVKPSGRRDINTVHKISTGRGGAGNIILALSRDIEPESGGHVNSAQVASRALSTGRGGAGNIRSLPRGIPSHFDSRTPILLANDAPDARLAAAHESRDGIDEEPEYEREVMARHRAAQAGKGLRSTGRGGTGNITRHAIP